MHPIAWDYLRPIAKSVCHRGDEFSGRIESTDTIVQWLRIGACGVITVDHRRLIESFANRPACIERAGCRDCGASAR